MLLVVVCLRFRLESLQHTAVGHGIALSKREEERQEQPRGAPNALVWQQATLPTATAYDLMLPRTFPSQLRSRFGNEVSRPDNQKLPDRTPPAEGTC